MDFTRKELGTVAVDSGQLVVGDPSNMGDRPDLCVTHPTTGGDGIYPVYELDIAGVKYLAVQLDGVMSEAKEFWKAKIASGAALGATDPASCFAGSFADDEDQTE